MDGGFAAVAHTRPGEGLRGGRPLSHEQCEVSAHSQEAAQLILRPWLEMSRSTAVCGEMATGFGTGNTAGSSAWLSLPEYHGRRSRWAVALPIVHEYRQIFLIPLKCRKGSIPGLPNGWCEAPRGVRREEAIAAIGRHSSESAFRGSRIRRAFALATAQRQRIA